MGRVNPQSLPVRGLVVDLCACLSACLAGARARLQDGTLSMAGDMELECLESTRDMGVRTLFMPPVDFTALVDRAPQVMQPGWPGPTVSATCDE